MMIDRRAFIQGAALAATTPVIAALLPLSPHTQGSPAPGGSALTTDPHDADSIVFKIDGWDCSDAEHSTENEVLISISQCWRVAWR